MPDDAAPPPAALDAAKEDDRRELVLPRSVRATGLRGEIPWWQAVMLGAAALVCVFAVWWFFTWQKNPLIEPYSSAALPGPVETLRAFPSLVNDSNLVGNSFATLRRVTLGFVLAVVIGVPLGILCGCFPRISAFFMPLEIFGRNVPMAVLIPITMALFGIDERQKVLFIFIATVAFMVFDSANALRDVAERYIDTAYTLGASRRQVVLKVLTPLAMPKIFNSLRLLFGLAFGYIMLAELLRAEGEPGLGGLINIFQRRSPERMYLTAMIIPLIAFVIDWVLHEVQKSLFPHIYGGPGILAAAVRKLVHAWEDLKGLFIKPREISIR
jgi:NitT/TauT family transport system permease protein